METLAVLAIGFAAVLTAAALMVRRRSIGRPAGTDRAAAPPGAIAATDKPQGPRRLSPTRIVVVGERRAPAGSDAVRDARAAPVIGPRHRLVRDASTVLLAIAAVILAASIVAPPPTPAGGVLSATGGSSSRAPGETPALATASPVRMGASPAREPPSPSLEGRTVVPSVAPATASPASAAPASAAPLAGGASAAPLAGGASAARLALLNPCPGREGCYLYVVRTGDTLLRIATFFGIPAATILRLNPTIIDPAVVVRGSVLVLPTPTR